MKLREWILLIFIVGVGLFFHFRKELEEKVFGELEINLKTGKSYYFKETKEIFPSSPELIRIENKYGKVKVIGGNLDKIEINLMKKIYSKDEEEAGEIAEKLKISLIQKGKIITISSNRDELKKKIITDFEIFLPKEISLKIYNPYGEVFVENINGKLEVKNSYAPLNISGIHNNCYLSNKYSSINANNVSGFLKIEHKYGSVVLNNINGETKIFAPHSKVIASEIQKTIEVESTYKEIDLRNVDKVKIKSRHSIIHINGAKGGEIYNNYGKLYLSNINGNLEISGKYLFIKGNNIFCEIIKISNSYRDVKLTDFSGGVDVSLSYGNLFLKPLKIISDIKVIANYSDIKFLWPKGEKVPFKGKVKYGKIKVFFPVKYYRENSIVYVKAFKDMKINQKFFFQLHMEIFLLGMETKINILFD